jgi:hypothetical protein
VKRRRADRRAAGWLCAAALAACSTAPPMPDPAPAHPASPAAEAAARPPASDTLVMPERTPTTPPGGTTRARGH